MIIGIIIYSLFWSITINIYKNKTKNLLNLTQLSLTFKHVSQIYIYIYSTIKIIIISVNLVATSHTYCIKNSMLLNHFSKTLVVNTFFQVINYNS